MKPREDFHEDFGLTGFTKYLAMDLTLKDEAASLDLARRLFEQRGPIYAKEVLDDARLLAGSRLPHDALAALWLAANRGRFNPVGAGLGIRTWLNRLENACVTFVRREEPSFVPVDPEAGADPDLRSAVLTELRSIAPDLAEAAVASVFVPPLPGLVPALEAAVGELGPDLGFRLFLRAMKVYLVGIGPARLERYEQIGRRLGYHDWVVEDGNLNIWPDHQD